MIILVDVKGKILSISLGSGNQSFKWLANVVSERIKSLGVLRKSFEEEQRTVICFKDSQGMEINPNDPICNVLSDKDTVYTELVESLPNDEFGNPILSEWMISAYVKSGNGIRWYTEMEAYRQQERKGDDEDDVRSSSLLFVGEFSARDIDTAFELDWQQMNWGWLGLGESDAEVRDMRSMLRSQYGLLCKIFSHYCGNGTGQDICIIQILNLP
jgi:hypothetical protein